MSAKPKFNFHSWQGVLIAIIMIACFFSCDSTTQRKDIKSYYFPLEEFGEDGRVYHYVTIDLDNKDTLTSRYSFYKYMEVDSGQIFITNSYNGVFFNDQYVMEEVVDNGTLLRQYHFMAMLPESDQPHIEKAQIIQNNAFPFFVRKNGGVIPMEMKFKAPSSPKEKIRFMRERQYIGDTIYTYKGEDRPAVIFDANEIQEFTHEEKGDFDNINYATEIYAKGLGLVSRRYNIGDARMEVALKDTFSMQQLEDWANQYWNPTEQ